MIRTSDGNTTVQVETTVWTEITFVHRNISAAGRHVCRYKRPLLWVETSWKCHGVPDGCFRFMAQTHQTNIKELLATEAECCITSHCLCLGRKAARWYTVKTAANGLLAHTFWEETTLCTTRWHIRHSNRDILRLRTGHTQTISIIKRHFLILLLEI